MWKTAEDFLRKDKDIAPLIQKYGSCTIRPILEEDYFDDLLNAICSQQLSIKAASTIFERTKKLLIDVKPVNILSKNDQELRECGLSFSKIKYIKDLSEKVLNNEIDLSKINKMSDEEVIATLVKVKGIGRWTAEMFLMFALGREDIFPLDDLGIQKAFEKVVGKKWDKVKAQKYAADNWKPYRTIASWYLWRSLENK